MSYRYADFQQFVALEVMIHNAKGASVINAELGAIATALASDTRTHDATIQAPPAALLIGPAQTRFTNDILLHVNAGLAGNLTQSQMIAAIDGVAGVLSPPAVVDVPYASANASPPIVGTVASVTNGNWIGTPSSYAYAWYRNGVAIGGATAATYTLVSADTGGKQLQCQVTATNATGSTAAPLSNIISVP
jgi:hypothetical protein